MNGWKVTTEPSQEPLQIDEAKEQLRVQHSEDNALINECIMAARNYCEEELDLAIMEQTITMVMDGFPTSRTILLPRANLLSVTSITYTDTSGSSQTYTDYTADTYRTPARIVNNDNEWPETKDVANAVVIVYKAGFTTSPASTPQAIKQAIKMLVTHFYDNRNAVPVSSGNVSEEISIAVTALLQKYRKMGV